MDKKYYLLQLLSPHTSLQNQLSKVYIATKNELSDFSFGCIVLEFDNISEEVISTARYLKMYKEVNILGMREVHLTNLKGIEETVSTTKGDIKIIYTELRAKVLYVNVPSVTYLRGYYIEVRNLAKVTKDGYIPLDKSNGLGNIEILQHNKRCLIKRGPLYIHNLSKNIMAYIDKEFSSVDELNYDLKNDYISIDLGAYVEALL